MLQGLNNVSFTQSSLITTSTCSVTSFSSKEELQIIVRPCSDELSFICLSNMSLLCCKLHPHPFCLIWERCPTPPPWHTHANTPFSLHPRITLQRGIRAVVSLLQFPPHLHYARMFVCESEESEKVGTAADESHEADRKKNMTAITRSVTNITRNELWPQTYKNKSSFFIGITF